jgi:hypothetical protein
LRGLVPSHRQAWFTNAGANPRRAIPNDATPSSNAATTNFAIPNQDPVQAARAATNSELVHKPNRPVYFASMVKLAQIVRIEADVSLKEPKPKTIEEVLQRVEHETGVEGRRAFEGFLKKMHKTKEEQGG